ncbi:Dnase i-like superfamily protein, partial [Thalictrum thalictroides]
MRGYGMILFILGRLRILWSNSSLCAGRIYSRIDRCLVNHLWITSFPGSGACFKPNGVSDHSHVLLCWYDVHLKKSPFRFSNGWVQLPGFLDIVKKGWQLDVIENPMSVLVLKLTNLKNLLRAWVANTGSDMHKRVNEARCDLFKMQTLLHDSPNDVQLAVQEKQMLGKYGNLARAELAIMKQRSDCEWMTMGDRGTRYFHSMVKERRRRNVIFSVEDEHGNTITDQNQISVTIVQFYEGLMGSEGDMEIDTSVIDSMSPRVVLTNYQ